MIMCVMSIDEIATLFPNLFGQPSAMLVPSDTSAAASDQSLNIGVVLSGGQAPGGHNVISGLFGELFCFDCSYYKFILLILFQVFLMLSLLSIDYLQERTKGSTLYGFRGGPAGIMNSKYVCLTSDLVYPYRNQVRFLHQLWLVTKFRTKGVFRE